ncbi:radical SAM protein [uncultured Chloroflexus sp.]|uniref:radical SAM protein n=1 Tax=uncultured Chloroflexus sp. TaxID=214040 RepID=UPI00262F07C2|nr:radical SAM protein [uncultured Chloroflexus sp.]
MTTGITLNLQRHYLTIAEHMRTIISFDGEGRPIVAFRHGANYMRGLSGEVLRKRVLAPGQKERRKLDDAERRTILAELLAETERMIEQIETTAPLEACNWLERIRRWDVERLEAERERFRSVYKPISILPPDQYRALVLQATEGCSWNRCHFCTFYRDRAFRIHAPASFRDHIQRVKEFVGAGLGLRMAIFLGDANALIIPQPRLRELLQVVHEEFTIGPEANFKGIYAFLDIFGAERKMLAEYRELAAAGVRRIYLGLESGDETVFRLLNKPGSPAEAIEAVRTIKAAGIAVGIILLVGAGGERFAAEHVQHSLAVLAAMPLGPDDIVYLSPLIVPPDSPYLAQLQAYGSSPLPETAINRQLEELKRGARAVVSPGTKVVIYHIEEFVY